MKQIMFSIFAHPDDESFGPSGTLLHEARNGTDLHLLCVTRGDAGHNCDGCDDLGAVRIDEWQAAGRLMGAASMQHFGYTDGTLCNSVYHEIADKIQTYAEDTVASYDEPVTVHFMTFDNTGLSGHLDHIAVSHIATFSFVRLQQAHHDWRFGRLRYFCLPYDKGMAHNVDYVYMPPGRKKAEIDEDNDVSDIYSDKLDVMRAHRSQREDMEWLTSVRGEAMKRECFRYLKAASPRSMDYEA